MSVAPTPLFGPWTPGVEDIFTDSENEDLAAGQEDEIEDAAMQLSLEQHLEMNRETLEAVLANNRSRVLTLEMPVLLSTAGGASSQNRTRFLIQTPVASRISSSCLHPGTYRDDTVQGVENLDALARLLGVKRDWRNRLECIQSDRTIAMVHEMFYSTSNSLDEAGVETKFGALMFNIGCALGLVCAPGGKQRFAVGGHLANMDYAVRGISDNTYVLEGRVAAAKLRAGVEGRGFGRPVSSVCDSSEVSLVGDLERMALSDDQHQVSRTSASVLPKDVVVLTTEVKTSRTFREGALWYRESRGPQALSALFNAYFGDKGSPSLIVTPKCFKLLLLKNVSAQGDVVANVEAERDDQQEKLAVYVYPGGYESGLVAHDDFCLMLGICILRAEAKTVCQGFTSPRRPLSAIREVQTPTPKKQDYRRTRGRGTEVKAGGTGDMNRAGGKDGSRVKDAVGSFYSSAQGAENENELTSLWEGDDCSGRTGGTLAACNVKNEGACIPRIWFVDPLELQKLEKGEDL
jgi:hypothetical protein